MDRSSYFLLLFNYNMSIYISMSETDSDYEFRVSPLAVVESQPTLNLSDVTEPCPEGTFVNIRKCSHNWPRYPCYNKKLSACQSTDGEILVDPLDDFLYALGETWVSLGNLTQKFLQVEPQRKHEQEEKIIRYIRTYGTTHFPLTNKFLKGQDYGRYYSTDDVVGYMEQAGDMASKAGKMAAKAGRKITKPVRKYILRQDSEDDMMGGNIYNTIVNPKSGKKISINSKEGKKILQNYAKFIK